MSRSIRKSFKNSQIHYLSKYSEAEFYEIVERLKAEAICPGRYRYMVNWYKRWTHGAVDYAEYTKRFINWMTRVRRPGWTGASKCFVNTRNRSYRQRLKQQLIYATETERWDAASWYPFIKDADWW